jgi:hypothetical protein
MRGTTYDVEVSPADVREAWRTIQTGGMPFTGRQKNSGTVARFGDYRSADYNQFVGASGPEIQNRLDHGHEVEAKDLNVTGAEGYSTPMVELDEETGDLLIDQVLSGEDLYRAEWSETEAPRSLTIRACFGMHAGVDAKVLGAYTEWVLKVMDAAMRRGIVPRLELWIAARGGFSGKGEAESMMVRIPLVEPGEMLDVTSWRAFLAPGAFRSLGFVALALGADQTPRYLNHGMGYPLNREWAISFEDDVLEIECPGGADEFPEQLMDELLETAYNG